jgi:hypothetical protein
VLAHPQGVAFVGYGKSARFDVLNRRYHAMMENSCRKDCADLRTAVSLREHLSQLPDVRQLGEECLYGEGGSCQAKL